MNTQDKNFDRIEAYLFGQMTNEEAANFEQDIAQDQALAQSVEQQRMEHRTMHLLLRKELLSSLEEWKQEKASTTQANERTATVVPMRRRILQYAVAACVVGLLGWFVNFWLNQTDSSGLAAEYFEASSDTVRSGGRSGSQELALALDEMRKPSPDYQAALRHVDAEKDSTYFEISLFLKGECYFRLKEYHQAASAFQQVIRIASSPVNRQKAEWYLLLTHLAAGGKDDPSFKALLKEVLSNSSHAFNREAISIQQKL
ncbi:MAG: hypothetical protein IPN76_26130 [Saprospiraceae bacterium]|nr:hypothetical protein [Saprospiraceae bacterium]